MQPLATIAAADNGAARHRGGPPRTEAPGQFYDTWPVCLFDRAEKRTDTIAESRAPRGTVAAVATIAPDAADSQELSGRWLPGRSEDPW